MATWGEISPSALTHALDALEHRARSHPEPLLDGETEQVGTCDGKLQGVGVRPGLSVRVHRDDAVELEAVNGDSDLAP